MIEYDPYSHEAMTDPFDLYARLRAEAPVYYIEKYNCWALARFEDIWNAALDQEHYTARGGQSPGQVMLGEPTPHTFMTMDPPEHRAHRGIIGREYTRRAAERDAPRIRALARELLAPLLPRGEFEVYAEYANRVTTHNAAYMAGVPKEDAEQVRAWIDGMLHREEGQVGASEKNGRFGAELDAYLRELIQRSRKNPEKATGHLASWLAAEIDGRRLSDDDIAGELFSLVVTGSETTPLSVAGTLVFLDAEPEQRDMVLGDLAHVGNAFAESLRYDQPTNMLARKVRKDVEVSGEELREGQGVLFLWASANRDEREFEDADRYDVLRNPRRTLSFGHGVHKCLGEHLGMTMGIILLEELLEGIGAYELDSQRCSRIYGEFLSGYNHVPIRFEPTELED
ncbi:MAG: cytochrome P450 [Deltaproteobacteria bacterium]|jgi:cytochrome P450|nr:cytochrome P450 [Deltaproteobacteria bacterium]MBW2500456.1 cytochrome P450 [Deltaproteobacteria bacterium]